MNQTNTYFRRQKPERKAIPALFRRAGLPAFIPLDGVFNLQFSSVACRQLLMLICAVALTIPLSGQTVLKAWNFDGFNGDEGPTLATFNATGIGATTGDVRRAAGIIAFPAGTFDNVFISRDFDNTTLAGARSASEYVKISIRPEAGFGLQLTELTIQIGRQGNGPNEFALFTDAGGDNFITQIGAHASTIAGTGNYETVTFDLTSTGLFDNCTTSSDAISFRLYGYGSSVDPAADFNRFWFGNGLADGTNDIEISGYAEAIPDAPTHPSETLEFCEGAGNPDRLLRLSNPSPIDGSGDQVVVWVVQSAPAAAGLTVGQEFMPPCSAPGSYTDANFFLSGTNDNSIRLQPAAPVGDYVFSAKVLNCNTGCESELSKETYTISKKADPVVSITADPAGDVCLNTLGVQYDPNLTATDGGTYAYAWCAYNNGSGMGTCFNGFDDNTAAMPTRDWVVSTGARSVGVTVSSTTPGCEASDLYSFTVNPNPAAPTEPAKTITFCEGASSSDRLLRLINPNPISGDQVVVWALQSAPAGVALAEYNPPCSVPGSFTSPDGFFFLSGTNDNSIRLEPAAPVGDYVFKAKVLDCATGCTSDLSAATYTISKFANPSDAFRAAGTFVSFPFSENLDFDAGHNACPGDVFEYGTEANTASINTVSWTLSGGGSILAGQNARNIQIEWTTPGTHTLSFLVTNIATGCTAANSLEVTVLSAPDVSINKFMQNPFNEVCVGTEARFLASADASGPPSVMTYDWTFSGSPSVMQYGQTASDNATKRNQGATYAGTGTETVDLTVTYDNGCSVDAPTHTVTVNPLPSDMFRSAGTFVSFPFSENLDFDADHNACPGDVFEYGTEANTASINTVSWTLSGGGNILAGQNARNIQIEWTTPGTHTLSFLVTNIATGCTATNSLEVTVLSAPDVSINKFMQNPFNEVCVGTEARFLASADASGPPSVMTYDWTFSGSPSVMQYGQTASDNATKRNQGATYAGTGTETVDLTVTYDNGCSVDAPTHTVTVNPLPSDMFRSAGTFVSFPFSENLDFDADHNACPGDVFEYGTEANTASINTVSWTLSGGGNILAGQNARNIQIEWTTPGTHTLSFLVTNIATGCTATNSLEVTVKVKPEIGFSFSNPANFGGEICNESTVDVLLELDPAYSSLAEGVDYEFVLDNISFSTDGGATFNPGYGPVNGTYSVGGFGGVNAVINGATGVNDMLVNTSESPVIIRYNFFTRSLSNETCNGPFRGFTTVVRPELKLAFDFKNPPGFANNEICNGGTVEIDLDVLPGQEAFYNEGSDYEIRNVIVRHRTGSGSTFVAGYGPVSGGTLNNGDVISGVNETLSHNEAEPVFIQYNFVLEDLVCGTQDFRSVVVEVRPQLKLAFDFSAPPGFANNALCNGSTVDIGVDALPAQAALYGLGSDYQVEVVVVRHRVGSVGSFANGYGPIMGGTLSNGDVITQINEPLSHDETSSVFVQYNLVLKDLKCGSNDFRSVVVEIKPQPKIGFVFKNPPSAFCPNSNEICNGDEVNFDLVSEAEGLVEGTDFEFRLLGAAYKIGGTCQGGGYTNGYGPVSGGISGGTTLSDYVATLSHSEADIVWVRLSFVAEDLSGCGTDDFRSVWVGVWPSPAGTISNSGPVCANADAFLTFEGTIGQPPFEVAIAELNGGNYTSAGAGNGNPFWTLQGLAPGSYTYTLTAIRDANGCETTGLNQQTTVVVLPEPVISCPGNITVQTSNNGAGDCTASASWTNPTESAGACTPITLTISIDNGTPQTVVQGETFVTTLSGGEHTITYVVTDGNNNQDDCSFTVTVEDDERPSSIALPDVLLTTENDGAECPGAANTSLVVDQVNPIATAADSWSYFVHGVEIDGFNDITDNCSDPSEIEIFVWEINEISTDECESSFKVFFRYYDEAGNWRQRGKEFTIVDDTRPSSIALQDMTFTTEDGATCPGAADTDLVVDQSNPIATAADNWSFTVHGQTVQGFNNITDNCSDPSEIEIFVWEINEIATGDCESSFKVFFRYFDACGNWRQRGQTFTIQDNTKPDFNKGGFSEAFTLTTEDGADCPANATVEGLETGDVLTPGVAAPFTVAGVAYTTPTDMVSDNCVAQSDLLLTVDVVNEDVMNEGDDCSKLLRVRYKLEDGCGNQRFFTQEFTVIDNTKPDFNKGGFLEAFTLTTEDGADCPANATVEGLETGDVLTPGVAAPFTVAGVSFTTPTDMVSDNCVAQSDLLLTVDVVNEDVMNEGDDCSKLLRVRYKLEDGCGNQRFFTQEFTVIDNTKPDFNKGGFLEAFTLTTEDGADCPANATVDGLETGDVLTAGVASSFTVAGIGFTTPTDMVSDNCVAQSDLLLTVDVVNEDVMNEGDDCSKLLRVRYKLEDGCGNQRFFTQEFTVTDNTKPDFTVPADITIYTDEDCEFDADPSETGDVEDESDNCTSDLEATFSDEVEAGSCEGEKIITRTWSVDDGCGNVTTKVQTITVEDNIDPEFTVPADITIYTDEDCGFDADPSETGDVEDESDNCTADLEATYTDEVEAGDCAGAQIITRTWSLRDDCGNTTTKVQIITVEDKTDPTFTVPENTTIFTDADCEYDADLSITGTVDDEADNCSADLTAKYADVIAAGSCAGEVVITRTWTLTDDCGNKTEQQQIITVEDNTAPTPVCLNGVLIPLDPDGERTLVAEDVFDFGASFDNCSTVSVTDISPALVDCDDVGGLTSIQVTASDDCGNEATCTATIEVSDITDLPSPWEGVDIGNPGSGSTYNYNPCVDEFIIQSGAYNTPTPTDNLATISQTLCSNANGLVGIQLKVESVAGGFGGVFIRESNAPDAKYVAVLKQNDTNLLSWERRTSTGGSLNRGTNGATFPFWLRIFRDGNLIRAQYSNTGNSWIPYRQIHLEMGTCVEVGMVAYTTHPNGTVNAVFSNVQVAGSSTAGTSSLAIDQGSNGVLPGLDQDALPITEGMDLSVFPNPATDQLTLKFGTELPELSTITLRNQLGQIMKQEQLRTPDTQMDWDISNLSTGTYFLEVRTSDGAPQVVKFLKTR